jgi:hypothetical protein
VSALNLLSVSLGQSGHQHAKNENYQDSEMMSLKATDLTFLNENLVDLDQKIYDYANGRLDYLIEIYGSEKMKSDLDKRFSHGVKGFRPKNVRYYSKKNDSWKGVKKVLRRIYDYSHGPDWAGECKVFSEN